MESSAIQYRLFRFPVRRLPRDPQPVAPIRRHDDRESASIWPACRSNPPSMQSLRKAREREERGGKIPSSFSGATTDGHLAKNSTGENLPLGRDYPHSDDLGGSGRDQAGDEMQSARRHHEHLLTAQRSSLLVDVVAGIENHTEIHFSHCFHAVTELTVTTRDIFWPLSCETQKPNGSILPSPPTVEAIIPCGRQPKGTFDMPTDPRNTTIIRRIPMNGRIWPRLPTAALRGAWRSSPSACSVRQKMAA